MITFLKGKLVEKHPTHIKLEVNNIGYEIHIPLSTFDKLPAPQSALTILTHLYVKEDIQQLYGFLTEKERKLFLLFISVSGIGPKIALAALSGADTRHLCSALASGDTVLLMAIPGIGRKTAQRMIVELKEKIGALGPPGEGAETGGKREEIWKDAFEALISLGYKASSVREVLNKALVTTEKDLSIEDLIRQTLKEL